MQTRPPSAVIAPAKARPSPRPAPVTTTTLPSKRTPIMVRMPQVPPPRVDILAKVTGRAEYVEDLPDLPGTLYAATVRSPYSHARIKSIDSRETERLTGFAGVIHSLSDPDAVLAGDIAHHASLGGDLPLAVRAYRSAVAR